MRRLVATAALALLALPLAAPAASAHTSSKHFLDWNWDPDEPVTPEDDTVVRGTNVVIQGFARFDDGVKSWKIQIRPEAGGEARVCEEPVPGAERTWQFECRWDTTRAGRNGDGGLSVNGRYFLEISAVNASDPGLISLGSPPPPESHTLLEPGNPPRPREVFVANSVSVPTGVGRSYDSGTRRVTVSWNPNPEPDISEYIIQEKVGDGAWTEVGRRSGAFTTFERPISEPGTYQYQVAAKRPEVSRSDFVATTALEVSPPEAAPTTTGSGDEPGPEGESGVPLPGTEDTTTTTGAPGTPPSTGPRPGGGSSLFSRPSAGSVMSPSRPFFPATTPTTADTGYQETLPYKPQEAEAPSPGDEKELADAEEPQVIEKIIEIPRPRNPRSLLVPLAGGLAMFVFAMQVTYMARRRPVVVPTVEEDFGDWLGL